MVVPARVLTSPAYLPPSPSRKEVEAGGGVARVFSSAHESGRQLGELTGVAATLRFPLPDLVDADLPPIEGMDANDYQQAGHDLGALLAPPSKTSANVVPIREFMAEGVGISYVWQHILARGWLYAMTANPGSGKTSVCLYMAVMMALGRPLMGKKTKPCKVLTQC